MKGFNWIKKLRRNKKSKPVIYRGFTFQSEIDQKKNMVNEKVAYHFLVWKTREVKNMVAVKVTIERVEE